MRLFLLLLEDDVGQLVTDEVTSAGAEVVDDVGEADALIIDEAHPEAAITIGRLHASGEQVPILLLLPPEQAVDPWEGVEEIIVKPPTPGETVGRLGLLTRRWRSAATRREALFTAALEAAGDIIEITSPDARYEYVNPAFEQILGYTIDEVIGRTPAQVIRSDLHDAAYFKKIDETLSAGKQWAGILISRARDERLVYLETAITPMRDADGRITHHMAVKRDITARIKAEAELRRKQEELEQARDAALEASRAKSQFLANMSHELRTPLNAIIGYAEMLIEDAEDDDLPEFADDLGKVRKAGQHLLSLINDVLDISKIEAGAMKLHLEAFDVRTTVAGVVTTVEPLLVERRNKLQVFYGDGLGTMTADLTKVRQTLLNLLGNAAKFTEAGEVTLRVSKTVDGGEPFFEFEIRDTGIGIGPEHLGRLFRPFMQADSSTSRRFGGTGLGLAISSRFCTMMGGRIEVESEEGVGSVFRVLLPQEVGEADEETGRATPRPEPKGRTVLVIDDDPTIRELLTRKLAPAGFHVQTAVDGVEGLARARDLRPDAIVLDVMMPELDGWAVLTELKGDERTTGIPVVLLTILEQSEVGFSLGAVDYLIKPVQTSRLIGVLRRHCRNDSARVLVIDDDPPSRDLVRSGLEAAGHIVQVAHNGQQGIEAIEQDPPDLIVLDLLMPVLDGFAVVEHLEKTPTLRRIPVVIVTAKDLTSEDRAMLRGAQAILQRTAYSRRELIDTIAERVTELTTRDD